MQRPEHNSPLSMAWKYALGPWMAAVILLSYLWAQDLRAFMDPPSARIIFWHVPMAMLGMYWFAVGAVHGYRYLYGKRQGEAELDRKVQFASELGLLTTVLATVTGMVFAQVQWGVAWNWDPKQVFITVLIVMYLAYFGLRMSIEDPDLRGRLSAVYAIIGAVSAPILMYVIPNIPMIAKLHPPGMTVATGLDPKWRLIYWMSTFGFLGITAWLYSLRLRAAAVEERLMLGRIPKDEGVRVTAARRAGSGGATAGAE